MPQLDHCTRSRAPFTFPPLSRSRRATVIAASPIPGYPSPMDAVARDPATALRPRRLRRRSALRFRNRLPGGKLFDVFEERPLGGRFRAIRRITMVLLWTLVAIPIQAVLML